MPTLLLLSFSALVMAGLAWFSTWAFWLHPPEGWLGRDAFSAMPLAEHERVRRAPWYRALKVATLLLGLITLALLVTMLGSHYASA